jgi:hypothetical protein
LPPSAHGERPLTWIKARTLQQPVNYPLDTSIPRKVLKGRLTSMRSEPLPSAPAPLCNGPESETGNQVFSSNANILFQSLFMLMTGHPFFFASS